MTVEYTLKSANPKGKCEAHNKRVGKWKKANAAFCLWEIQPCKYKDMQTAKLVSSNVHFKKNLQKKQVFQMFLI